MIGPQRNAADRLLPGEGLLFILYHLRRIGPLLLIPLVVPLPNVWTALGVSGLGLSLYAAWQHSTGNLFFSMVHVRVRAQGQLQLRQAGTDAAAVVRSAAVRCVGVRKVSFAGRVQLAPRDLMPMVEYLLQQPPEMAGLLVVRHVARLPYDGLRLPNVPGARCRSSLLVAISSTPVVSPSQTDRAVGLLVRCVLMQSNIGRAARLLAQLGQDEMLWLPPDHRLPRSAAIRQRVVAEMTAVTGDLAQVITRHRNYRKGLGQ